jgi:hypothetical protein
MTEASNGLRKALARGQSGTVQTLAEMSNDELLAGLSDEQKTALAASLASAAVAGSTPEPEAEAEEDGDDAEMGDGKKKMKDKEEYMGDDNAKAATDRAVAVMSSEHFAGREAQAANLLKNGKLSADEIVGILAECEPAKKTDPEAAARSEMQAALKQAGNSSIDANNGGAQPHAAASGAIWEKTYAELGYIKPAA